MTNLQTQYLLTDGLAVAFDYQGGAITVSWYPAPPVDLHRALAKQYHDARRRYLQFLMLRGLRVPLT